MNIKYTLTCLVISGMAPHLVFAAAAGPSFPLKPIRVVTAAAGGSNDAAARLIGQGLTANLGQQVVVDNRGGFFLPGQVVSRAAPDGYTMLFSGIVLWIGPLLRDGAPFDPLRDFVPVTLAVSSPNVVVVHPSLPAKSIQQLVSLAMAKPGALNYSSGSTGASAHLAGELFMAMTGVKMVRIPYKGAGPSLSALMSGEVQLSFPAAASGMPHVRAGRLRALAVTSSSRSVLVPELPTVSESGVPGFESASIVGFLAPAKTPPSLIHQLNREIRRVLDDAETRKRFLNTGTEAVGSSPEEFMTAIKSETARFGKVIREAGIRAD